MISSIQYRVIIGLNGAKCDFAVGHDGPSKSIHITADKRSKIFCGLLHLLLIGSLVYNVTHNIANMKKDLLLSQGIESNPGPNGQEDNGK